jgi:hypothetical protein
MPTVLRYRGYKFFFYSHEPNEPPHVHVDKSGSSAKFWLEPIALAKNMGYTATELKQIYSIAEQHQSFLIEKWHEYFNE